MVRMLPRRARVALAVRVALSASTVLAVILSLTGPSFAAGGQFGNLNGTVVDQQTKNPIAGASVTVASPSGTRTAKTQANGFFSILGIPVDTYLVTIEVPGYEPLQLPSVTVQGDQNLNLGNVAIVKSLRQIARVTTRSRAGAFQPTQTQDSYTISGARIEESSGRPAQTNQNNVVLAAPGVTLTYSGSPTIRGGRLTEVGYQLDGVSFDEPYVSGNGATTGTRTGGSGLVNGLGSIQVVEGAGDASQGLVGSGVINVIPKRGTAPGFGFLQGVVGGPNYYHQFAGEYGFALDDNAISEYVAYNAERFQPYYATPAADYGNFFKRSFESNNQFLNNLIVRFGRDKNQSLQFLYSNDSVQSLGSLGGWNLGPYNPTTNPAGLAYYPFYPPAALGLTLPNYSNVIGLNPNTPAGVMTPTGPQESESIQTEFLKFEYDNNLDRNTYLALRYYNWSQIDYGDNSYSLGSINGNVPAWQALGGPTTGMGLDLTRQVGSKLTLTANGLYEVQHPIVNVYYPTLGPYYTDAVVPSNDTLPGSIGDGNNGPRWADFLPGGYLSNFSSQLPNGAGRFPIYGTDFRGAYFQQYGAGFRAQYNPTTPLKLDFGVRYEGQNQHWTNPFNPDNEGGNPFDVPAALWTKAITNPTEWEPRAAASYQLGLDDAVRASYGRSSIFGNAQSAGTPLGLYGVPAAFFNIPPKPNFSCGTQYGVYFTCSNYAQQLYWAIDRHGDAPDAGGILPANYNNYDFSYQHLFRNGWGSRVTGFYKLGTSLPATELLLTLPNGQQTFQGSSEGFNRTTGVGLSLTTPERPYGISGFLSATYQNVLQSVPPLSNFEANGSGTVSRATLALGDVYRAGYVSPFSLRTGATFKTKGGLSITPTLQFDVGYPYSEGNLIAAQVGTDASGHPIYANIPQVNFGPGAPIIDGFYQQRGSYLATNYYDPAFPGTPVHPNISGTRGTPATASSGGYLWTPNLNAALTVQYKWKRSTLGVSLQNLFGNAYNGAIPLVNPFYQTVATGVSGPLTGVNSTCGGSTAHGCGNIPTNTYAFKNGAYLLSNGNIDFYQLAPLTPFNAQVFYQLAL